MDVRISFLIKVVAVIVSDAQETATAGETKTCSFPGFPGITSVFETICRLCKQLTNVEFTLLIAKQRKAWNMETNSHALVDICLNIA